MQNQNESNVIKFPIIHPTKTRQGKRYGVAYGPASSLPLYLAVKFKGANKITSESDYKFWVNSELFKIGKFNKIVCTANASDLDNESDTIICVDESYHSNVKKRNQDIVFCTFYHNHKKTVEDTFTGLSVDYFDHIIHGVKQSSWREGLQEMEDRIMSKENKVYRLNTTSTEEMSEDDYIDQLVWGDPQHPTNQIKSVFDDNDDRLNKIKVLFNSFDFADLDKVKADIERFNGLYKTNFNAADIYAQYLEIRELERLNNPDQ